MKESNWTKLKAKIVTTTKKSPKLPKVNSSAAKPEVDKPTTEKLAKDPFTVMIEKQMRKRAVALDCEMVGLGPTGKQNALARCSIVDFNGNELYDEIVKPKGFVTDFRTKYSGIRKSDLRQDKEVVTFEEVSSLNSFSWSTHFTLFPAVFSAKKPSQRS